MSLDMPINVLFVEDEADLRTVVVEALSDQGFAVTSASDGVEAVAYLQGKTQYAVVVTDVSMPGGISGLDVAAQVAETQPGARVLVVSGLQRSQLPPIPASVRFLPKPYRFKQLITAIHEQLS
ncbi:MULTISPECIES: response regulator [Stenotrophomonas]|uniref:response regulator n=1 Tax=Stenotrophomonas TaxID=40323 RepID=UPI0021C79ACE|nr:response regulator [Stenotrophomonas sp. Ste96]